MAGMPVSSSPSVAVALHRVVVYRDGHAALRGVDMEARAGRVLVVAGPNGSGKSTLLDVAAGLREPDAGRVTRHEGSRVALVPQAVAAGTGLPLTVADVVAMGTWRRLGAWRPMRRQDRDRVSAAIDAMGLSSLARRPVGTLSGGQRQRTFIAQALVQEADLLLLDEPMSGLDDRSRAAVAGAITAMASDGAAVVVVTHDPGEIAGVDETLELVDGRVRGG